MTLNSRSFFINEWQVDPGALRIASGGKELRLEPRVMRVLVYLAERPREVVSRQELEDHVWTGMVVGYDAVTNTITKLRKAFGDSSSEPRFIETIPKTGYRMIATVTPAEDDLREPPRETPSMPAQHSRSRWWMAVPIVVVGLALTAFWWQFQPATRLPLPDEPSIAVMPFINTGNDPRQNYFIDGITEDLITDLSNVSGLFVIARNSSFAYKGKAVDVTQVAGELGVRFILQGSLRRDNEQVRINVRLMDGITGRNLWAERYDTELDDLFAVQDEVTRQITSALSVRLTQAERQHLTQRETLDPDSYDEFLKGWERYWRFSRDDFAVAEQHFKKALSIDPSNSRAHAGLALIYWQAWRQKWHENFGNPHAGWTRARRELKLAMSNPTPLAHSTRSSMLLINRRYDEAIAEAEKAIQLNQNHAGGYLALADALSYSGRPEGAIEMARKGMRLDPNFVAPYLLVIGRAQFDMGLYEDAVESLERAVVVNPHERDAHIVLLAAYGYLGESDQAGRVLAALNEEHEAQALRPFTMDWLTNRWPYRRHVDRDHLLAGLDKAGVPPW
ncbi:winged helix-turn-helix domain-containing tetratricopeptide repeat protein [Thiocapsa bogorovii]|uniref:winged helix-turn-helix domain-containing tetratricopeptide repeat protein n=1 Tax=Thiocapsa bogorovii TaxID=521689 RepID=UPI001E61A475|nr:winged helix-turn-helix domain-containing protein [Thiocapsa bogorovii]UHD15836.1 winged helix-turn-helix domain-containing protein [Thiocapsa bogorovii]